MRKIGVTANSRRIFLSVKKIVFKEIITSSKNDCTIDVLLIFSAPFEYAKCSKGDIFTKNKFKKGPKKIKIIEKIIR